MAEKSIIILLICCIELLLVQTLSLDYTDRNNKVFGEGVFVQSSDPHPEAWLKRYQKHSAFCDKDAVKIVLPSGALSEVKFLGSPGLDPGLKEEKECSYSLTKKQRRNVLRVSFSGCHVTAQEGKYTLQLLYRKNMGPVEVATVSCDANSDLALQKLWVRRSDGQIHWALAPMPDLALHRKLPQNYTRAECTADGHFVFTIYSHVTTMPVSPTSLHVASKNPCKPVLATNEFATFKFSMTECGTKFYNIGDTTIYMAEVRTAIRTHNLKYSIITRDHPADGRVSICKDHSDNDEGNLRLHGKEPKCASFFVPTLIFSSARFSFLPLLDSSPAPFMNVTTQKYVSEEIYFMCSTEVCMPSETPCRKTCFDKKA